MKIKFTRSTCGIGYGYMEGCILDTTKAQALEFVELGFATILEETKEGLPVDIPGRAALIEAGIMEVKDIPLEIEQLVEIDGIGDATANKIIDYLKK